MAVEIPLLPLGSVLFPHMPMSLHIFEQRYRAMMRDCRAASTTFGIVAIREGIEVGATAVAVRGRDRSRRLDDVEELEDGRYNLTVDRCLAVPHRVDLLSSARTSSRRCTTCEDLPAPADDTERLAASVTTAFRGYATQLQGVGQGDTLDFGLPSDPELLSYLVAAAMQVEVCAASAAARDRRHQPSASRRCSASFDARPPCSIGCWCGPRTTPPPSGLN